MRLFIEKDNVRKNLRFSGSVSKLLAKLKINPESVVVAKNKGIVTEDEIISDSDSVELLSVVSGG
ncbi:MAG: MoaD/ThiS family protein [Nanoarchaeota archaeon]